MSTISQSTKDLHVRLMGSSKFRNIKEPLIMAVEMAMYIELHGIFNIPKTHIARLMKIGIKRLERGLTARKQSRAISQNGNPRFMTDDLERILTAEIMDAVSSGSAMTKVDVNQRAAELKIEKARADEYQISARKISVDRGYTKRFMDRNELISVKPSPLQNDKFILRHGVLYDFWGKLGKLYSKYEFKRAMVFNADETAIVYGETDSKIRAVTGREHRKAFIKAGIKKFHLTCMVCVCADGTLLPTTIITPRKTISQVAARRAKQYRFSFSYNHKGWMTKRIFERWVEDEFIPQVIEKRRDMNYPADEPALLVLDGHSSRRSPVAMDMLISNHIFVAIIPAHSSHVTQPLDVVAFGVFKSRIGKKKIPENYTRMLQTIHGALSESMVFDKLESSFERSGMYPLDLGHVINSDMVFEDPTEEITTGRVSISNSIITNPGQLQEILNEISTQKLNRKKRSKAKNPVKRRLSHLFIHFD